VTRLRGGKSGSQESVPNAEERNMLVKLGVKIVKSTTSELVQEPKGIEKSVKPMLRKLEHANSTS
jgi:hypothetical protein